MIFVWGGNGTVQRCIDALVGRAAAIAILPAGTANLLVTNLGVPTYLVEAVRVGLRGHRRPIDTGSANGEHFAVMAGAGFDALMIRDADGGMKDRIGRAAYVWTGAKNLAASRGKATVDVDGQRFFKGLVSCVLAGNGVLELGIVTAKNPVQWIRTLGRVAVGKTDKSPFAQTTRGKKFKICFDRPFAYELDGGARPSTKRLRIRVHPSSILICVPARAKPEISSGAVDQN